MKQRISKKAYRFWEMLPGMTSWFILLLPVILSFFWPSGVAIFIIIFDSYWLVKAFLMGGHLVSGFLHMRRADAIDWQKRLAATKDLSKLKDQLKKEAQLSWGWHAGKIKEDLQQVEHLMSMPEMQKDWEDIHHVDLLVTYNEPEVVLRHSIESAVESNYPRSNMIMAIGVEERAGQEQIEMVQSLVEEYEDYFEDFLCFIHPHGLEGEIKAKGANATWALKGIRRYLDRRGIEYGDVIVSVFDADTAVHPDYFSELAYKYVMTPERTRRSYQPIPIYNNNIWDVPASNRLVAFGTSFWQMIEATRPYRLVNFSSQSMSMQTLIDIDYVDVGVVSEDSRQFYRAYYNYLGDHKAIPIFNPVYMDAVLVNKGYWATLKAQYMQKLRWAYGIEHFPYLMEKFFTKRDEMSWLQRIVHPWRVFEGHIAWSTSSLLILLGAWLPILLNSNFRETVLAFNLPILARNLLSITWIAVVLSALIAFFMLPARPKEYSWWKNIEVFLQWILVPLSGIIFGSIPALHAETKLLLGRYMGFNVTEKYRKELISGSKRNEEEADSQRGVKEGLEPAKERT